MLWLLVSTWLPNRARGWRDLLPGAAVPDAALMVIHVLVVFVLFPYLEQKAATYGGLGLAAGLMLALYGSGTHRGGDGALNAELVDQREALEARLADRRAAREAARDATHRLAP